MTRPALSTLKTPLRPALKSPLRTATMAGFGSPPPPVTDSPADSSEALAPVQEISAQQLRQMQISELCAWLRTQTNKHKRPFQEQTIIGYAETARAFGRWMASQEIDGDFTACDVAMLNEFFSQYRAEHGQGGTNPDERQVRPDRIRIGGQRGMNVAHRARQGLRVPVPAREVLPPARIPPRRNRLRKPRIPYDRTIQENLRRLDLATIVRRQQRMRADEQLMGPLRIKQEFRQALAPVDDRFPPNWGLPPERTAIVRS
jgi:hypothetical protein